MEKNVEFLSFETVSILLATFPNSDGEFENILKKKQFNDNIKNLQGIPYKIKEIKLGKIKIKNQIILSFKDLKKLIDNPSNILRFVLNGRVNIKGNIKEILKVLEKI